MPMPPKKPSSLFGGSWEPTPSEDTRSTLVVTPQMAQDLTRQELVLSAYDAVRLLRRAVQDPLPLPTNPEELTNLALFQSPSATQVKAAIAILDRTGFGPSSTLMVADEDLSGKTDDELLAQIEQAYAHLRAVRMTRRRHARDSPSDDDESVTH